MNTLTPIEYNNQRILTTQQLADNYETDVRRISENFNRNEDRYTVGKHYHLLEGEELKTFKREYANCGIAENINKLYLWTEKGALLHAKSLNTDIAWQVYDILVETYFSKHTQYDIPQTYAQALLLAAKQAENIEALQLEVKAKEQIIEEQKPMALFGNALSSSETSILIGEFAKILKQNGLNIGQNKLFEWLREKKYLCKEGERYNKPSEYSTRLGLMEYQATVISRSNGTYTIYTPKLTAKGQEYFISMFQKKFKPHEIQQTLQYSLLTT